MSTIFELIQKRESCRAYQDKPVEHEKLIQCLEAAHLAPSACNSQPWRFVVAEEPELVKEIAGCVYDGVTPINRFASTVPAFVVVVEGAAKLSALLGGKVKQQEYAQIDLGLTTAQFCLAATELGLGTCILGWFQEKKLKALLSIPEKLRVRLVLAVGYAANDTPRPKSRKDLAEVACFGKYSF